MARRRKIKKRHSRSKPSVLSTLPLVFIGAAAYQGYKEGGAGRAIDLPLMMTTGMHFYQLGGGESTSWKPERMLPFMGVLAGTWVAKKVVKASGVNHAMRGMPVRL